MLNALRAASLSVMVTASAAAALTSQSATATPPSEAERQSNKPQSATGRIVTYDASRRTLVLSTPQGNERFLIGSDTRIQQSAKTISAATLSSLAGHAAKVRYTVSGQEKTAESVMVCSFALPACARTQRVD